MTTKLIVQRMALALTLAAGVTLIGASQALAGPAVYKQDPTSWGAWGEFSNVSHHQKTGSAANNFSLQSGADVNKIAWWGSTNNENGATRNISSFVVEFFTSDAQTGVGEKIYSEEFVYPAVQRHRVSPDEGYYGNRVWRFEADFTTPVEFEGSTEYWVAITAVLENEQGAAFYWLGSAENGDERIARTDSNGAWSVQHGNWERETAFRLGATAIPLPTSVWMGLAGLAVVAWMRVRRSFGMSIG